MSSFFYLGKLSPQANGHCDGVSAQLPSCSANEHLRIPRVQCLQGTFWYWQRFKCSSKFLRMCRVKHPFWQTTRQSWQLSQCSSFCSCRPSQEQSSLVHVIFILLMSAFTTKLTWIWSGLKIFLQTKHLFCGDVCCISIILSTQHLQALCPHWRDTGLFISSWLKYQMKLS